MVKADHAVPPADKWKFVIVRQTGLGPILHKGLPSDFSANISDLEALWDAELLRQGVGSKGSFNFSITPLGFMYAQWLRESTGDPVQRVTDEIRGYVASEDFKSHYKNAYAKWAQAEAHLWGEDSDQQLTTIGHLCREALQEFATALVDHHNPPSTNTDKTKTIDRMRAVLNCCSDQLGGTVAPFLDALLVFWGTVSDLVQRQEHGAQKEGGPLVWEDARRVVFQTAVVMFEIDRCIRPTK